MHEAKTDTSQNSRPRIFIDGLPRTGTTALAQAIGSHPDVRCLIEPFHPRRYQARFNSMALRSHTVGPAMNFLWQRWNLIKHVWEPRDGWPFSEIPSLNEELWSYAGILLAVRRRNFLKRYVSAVLSRRLRFWIGTRNQFLEKMRLTPMLPLNAERARKEIEADQQGLARRKQVLESRGIAYIELVYEEVFDETLGSLEQHKVFNTLFSRLGLKELPDSFFIEHTWPWLESDKYKWANDEIYRMIPGINEFENEVGSEDIGWLFR